MDEDSPPFVVVVAPSGRVLTREDLDARAKYANFGIVASALASTMAAAAGGDAKASANVGKMTLSPQRPLRRPSPPAGAEGATPPLRSSAEEEEQEEDKDFESASCSSYSSVWTEASSAAPSSSSSRPPSCVSSAAAFALSPTASASNARTLPSPERGRKAQPTKNQQQQQQQPVFSLGASSTFSLAPLEATSARRAAREARRAKRLAMAPQQQQQGVVV